MKNDHELRDLEAQLSSLWNAAHLPTSLQSPNAPAGAHGLKVDPLLRALRHGEPRGRAPASLGAALGGSPEGRRLWIESELARLREAAEPREEFIHEGPFGVHTVNCPARLRGVLVHVVESPPYRPAAFTAAERAELAAVGGRTVRNAEAAADAIAVLDKDGVEQMRGRGRVTRDLLTLALESSLQLAERGEAPATDAPAAALGVLAEGMAQHLNNLLSVILGYASLVADRGGADAANAESLRRIVDAAQKGRRFTQEILTVARSATEEAERVCPIHDRIQGAVGLLQPRYAKVQIETALKARNDRVVGPPHAVQQTVFHLLASALDGLPAEATLTVATENVREGGGGGAELLRIVVGEASGRGAPAETGGGSGLAGVFGLIGRLDGNVEVATDGRIVVTVPTTSRAADTEVDRRMRPRLTPSQIWLVDDDPTMRALCRHCLEPEGHTLEEIAEARKLDRLLRAAPQPPDLIVYDFGLPDRGGLEACRGLRDVGVRTPVLLLSGLRKSHPDIAEALKLRKTFFLQKPFTARDLSDMVAIAMGDTLVGA